MEADNGIHRSDTIEEKMSLVNRFGVTISYSKPSQKEYFSIVTGLAEKAGITMSEEELKTEANKWELSHGGISGYQQYRRKIISGKNVSKNKAGNHTNQYGTQRTRYRPPGFCDMYRTKINAQAVEHGFRTAHHDGCCHAGKGIRSVFFENIEEQTI